MPSGYFVLDFNVTTTANGTTRLERWPHFVCGRYSDPAAVRFWLRQMAGLESVSAFRESSPLKQKHQKLKRQHLPLSPGQMPSGHLQQKQQERRTGTADTASDDGDEAIGIRNIDPRSAIDP